MSAKLEQTVIKDLTNDHEQYVLKLMNHFAECEMTHLELEIDGLKVNLKKEVKEIIHSTPVMHSPATNVSQPILSTPVTQIENIVSVNEDIHKSVSQKSGNEVLAPLVGTFYASNVPGGKAFVSVGDHVKKGQVLCIIEAMKVMNEIESPYDGVLKEINVSNEDAIGFNQVLMVIE